METTFNLSDFILSLIANGGSAMLVSGWVSTKWTHASGLAMVIQTWITAIVLTLGASVVGLIPLPVSDVWGWIVAGFSNGVLANILYKTGAFDAVLELLKARTTHQTNPTP